MLEKFARENPKAVGAVLGSHGLFTWGDDDRACYETTLSVINKAIAWLAEKTSGRAIFGGARVASPEPAGRREVAARLMPAIRGLIGRGERKVGHFDDSPAVLEFVNSDAPCRACRARHLLPRSFPADQDPAAGRRLRSRFRRSRQALADSSNRSPTTAPTTPPTTSAASIPTARRCAIPTRSSTSSPASAMITFARDKATARIASEFYRNAINVMRGASTVDTYFGLPEQEAFNIEYWLLEEAKLQRMPKPKSLAGRVALVTGGGRRHRQRHRRALSRRGRLRRPRRHRPRARSTPWCRRSPRSYGNDNVRGVARRRDRRGDRRERLRRGGALSSAASTFSSPMPASPSAAPIEDTTLDIWDRNMDILAKGYFLVSREAFRLMKRQKLGGSSSSSPRRTASPPRPTPPPTAPPRRRRSISPAASRSKAPATASASTSSIPTPCSAARRSGPSEWREQRAAAYKMKPDELEEHYRQRSLLKLERLPRGRRRGRLLPRLRHVGEVDRQHHQCRRRQRGEFHAVTSLNRCRGGSRNAASPLR